MGSSCSSGQTHKDKDSVSTRSEESPSYQVQEKNGDKKDEEKKTSVSAGVVLSVSQPTEANKPLLSPPVNVSEPPVTPAKPKLERVSSPRAFTPERISAAKERKIVIYVCAADSQDCKVEKSLLHNEVYPELRQTLQKTGFELHLVDLHWSLQDKTAEPAELCLHELARQSERAYIIPVVFLNDSLGSPLLPKTLECSDFETAFQVPDKALGKWYTKDEQAQPPCYRLRPASAHVRNLKSSIKEERDKALKEWRMEVDQILGIMLSAFQVELRDTYLTTVVEQEVQSTVLMSRELASRCIWLYRAAHTMPSQGQLSPGDQELKRRLENLKDTCKKQLEDCNILKVVPAAGSEHSEQPEYLSNVVALLKKRLGSIIEAIVEEHNSKVTFSGLDLGKEITWHRRSAQKNSLCGANRQALLDLVEKSDSDGVIIFTGPEGCGKSALLARLVSHVKGEVVYRQVGITRYTSTLVCVLFSILRELEGDKANWNHPHNIETYSSLLYSALEKNGAKRPTVLIIDGIDQFREFGLNVVTWLPRTLPKGVKIVISLCDTSDLLISRLKAHLDKTNAKFVPVPDLSKEEGEVILMSSILEYNHSINPSIQDCVVSSLASCTLPLYVKVLAWQTTWCAEYQIALEPEAVLRDQLSTMLQELETMLGKEQVEKALSLLCSSKWGLTDSEIMDVLCSDSAFHTPTTYLPWAGACLFWSKLTRHLGPFVELGEDCANLLVDPSLAKTVRERYRSKMNWARTLLYRYFTGQLWEDGKKIKARMLLQPTKFGDTYNRRKLEELPYLTLKTQGSAAKYSLDPDWIFDKLCGSTVHQLLEDLYLENENEDVAWLCKFLEMCSPSLEYDGRQLYAQIARYRFPLATPLGQTLQGPPRVVSLIESEVEEDEEMATEIDLVVRLPHNHSFIVTVSTNAEEICVWDISRCKRVRQLKEVPQPTALEMVDDFKCVVLCKRELRTYDLNTGSLLTILKGVMNQKMPYFGLHDSDHLVALSRSRMYVNLMNLTSGDLVTTFKAGEDRFLNSLLVSGDGRILVCGDETQKPMPLLVWNLSSRKLLYDLRIPQHDFLTKLSAITHNGGYVSVIAKEVDEPSPNYIVVYDLQSGTLFKKWKRGVDTVSVDISSTESCVVSGHSDLSIIVWDLVTGNCRWKLKGHRSPPDYLRLSPSGSILLSRSTSSDIALRLWSLSDGSLLSVFSPDSRIQASDLTDTYVILSCDSGRRFTSLQLQGPGYTFRAKEEIYGDDIEMR